MCVEIIANCAFNTNHFKGHHSFHLVDLNWRSSKNRSNDCTLLSILLNVLGIAGQAGKKKSQSKLDAEKLGLLEQNKEVADMLDEMSSDRYTHVTAVSSVLLPAALGVFL